MRKREPLPDLARVKRACLAVLFAACSFSAAPLAAEDAADISAGHSWAIARMILQKGGESSARGLVLYTKDADRNGAAFRCIDGKLYVVLSFKPTNMKSYLTNYNRSSSAEITYRVASGEPVTETWVTLFGGRLGMPRTISATNRIYRAAADGETIVIQKKRGDPIRIELPPLDARPLARFMDECALKPKHDPRDADPMA